MFQLLHVETLLFEVQNPADYALMCKTAPSQPVIKKATSHPPRTPRKLQTFT
jgi:hypothetical protein